MSNTVEHSLLHSYQRNFAMALPRLVSCVDQSVIQKQQRGLYCIHHLIRQLAHSLLPTLFIHFLVNMRSPVIAFSILAAAVSPTLVSAGFNGNAVTHPRVTEVETKGSSNPLQVFKRQLNAEQLNRLQRGPNSFNDPGNPINALLDPLKDLPGTPVGDTNQKNNAGASSNDATTTIADDPLQDSDMSTSKLSKDVGNTAATTGGGAPVEPVAPATPYAGGKMAENDAERSADGEGLQHHSYSKADLTKGV